MKSVLCLSYGGEFGSLVALCFCFECVCWKGFGLHLELTHVFHKQIERLCQSSIAFLPIHCCK